MQLIDIKLLQKEQTLTLTYANSKQKVFSCSEIYKQLTDKDKPDINIISIELIQYNAIVIRFDNGRNLTLSQPLF